MRFFRDCGRLKLLVEQVRSTHGASPAPIRAWVASGTVGEDAYSLCMKLLDSLPAAAAAGLRVFGTARDAEAVARARSGLYAGAALLQAARSRGLDRFLVPEKGGYRIAPEVRQRCVFTLHDVVEALPFNNLDAAVCALPRAAFSAYQAARVEELFQNALSPGAPVLFSDPAWRPRHEGLCPIGDGLYRRCEPAVGLFREDFHRLLSTPMAVHETAKAPAAPRRRRKA